MLWAGGLDADRVPAQATRHYALAVVQCALGYCRTLEYGLLPGRRCVWLAAQDPARLASDLGGRAGYLHAVDESDFTSATDEGPWQTSRSGQAPVSIGGGSLRVPDLFLELQRLAGDDVRLLAFRHAELSKPLPPPDFWLDFGQLHFLETGGLKPLGHGAIGTVYDVAGRGQVLKESRCAVGDLVPGQGIFWHQTRFASSPFARSAGGVVPLLRYGFRRAGQTAPLLAQLIADGPYSRYGQEWEHRSRSLLVMQTLWPKAKGEPLSGMLRSPAAAGLPQVLVRLERVLAEMHAAGYAHNDLHAGNILVQGPHQVTVIDYDLVRPANADSTWGDYMSLACLTFDANHMSILEKFFPEGGVRTKLASAGLAQLPRLRHYAHVGRWEPLSALDLLLFQRQHLQLLGLDPDAVSYDLPPHVTMALLASTTNPRAFRVVLERAAPAPVVAAAAAASQVTLRLPPRAHYHYARAATRAPAFSAPRLLLLPSQQSSTQAKPERAAARAVWPTPRLTDPLSERGPELQPDLRSDERQAAAPERAHKRTRREWEAEASCLPAPVARAANTGHGRGAKLELRLPGGRPLSTARGNEVARAFNPW